MVLLCAVTVAIKLARERGVLKITREFNARLGNEYWAISDDHGLITVALSEAEAMELAA